MLHEYAMTPTQALFSVVSKCNNDEFHFDAAEKFELYLEHLWACKVVLDFEIVDIVCMSNHVHELYRVTGTVPISDILRQVKGHFARKFNRRFGRRHHFWHNKAFYRPVEDEVYAFHLMNYFHWNPVRAGLVRHPAEWPYSGYRFHILGERCGRIGSLLTPLPEVDPSEALLNSSEELVQEIARLLSSHKLKYFGKPLLNKWLK